MCQRLTGSHAALQRDDGRDSPNAFFANFAWLVRQAVGTGLAFTFGVAQAGAFCYNILICMRRGKEG